jgi:hypothetical protein
MWGSQQLRQALFPGTISKGADISSFIAAQRNRGKKEKCAASGTSGRRGKDDVRTYENPGWEMIRDTWTWMQQASVGELLALKDFFTVVSSAYYPDVIKEG